MKKRKIRNDDDGCHAADDDELGRDDAYHPRRAFGSRAMTVDGRDSFAVKMDEEHFSRIRDDGFHGGDAADILKRCRTSENEPYDEEEVREMLDDLYERGVTVNAPFCCARGAVELKRCDSSRGRGGGGATRERDARRFSSMNRRRTRFTRTMVEVEGRFLVSGSVRSVCTCPWRTGMSRNGTETSAITRRCNWPGRRNGKSRNAS